MVEEREGETVSELLQIMCGLLSADLQTSCGTEDLLHPLNIILIIDAITSRGILDWTIKMRLSLVIAILVYSRLLGQCTLIA